MTDRDCDLLVLGSGAAGLAAAVTGAHHGLRVILAEKDSVLGGTTAWSGGWVWAPGNAQGQRAGFAEAPDAPRRYLQAVLGNRFEAARVDAFLTHAPRMVAFFQNHTALQFDGGFPIPDTYGDVPGAGPGGRSVIAAPFDGRALGPLIGLIRPPLRETAFWGLPIQAGADLRAFLTMTRNPASALHVARRMARHLWDLARHGRALQLRNGNALVARLVRSAADLGVSLRTESPAQSLILNDGRVAGAVLGGPHGPQPVQARCGVVLATGGFPHAGASAVDGVQPCSLAVSGASGDGLRLALAVGGTQGPTPAAASALCPVSMVRWPDGREAPFPHIIDRGKPGVIGVLRSGKRFCNEGLGYHDYVTALLAATGAGQVAESWLVCDHRFLRRYGLGIVRPAPLPWRGWERSGYLVSAPDPATLARKAGIDPAGLIATLEDWNRSATTGADPAFGRGTTPYMRLQGDPDQRPNPCVAPILQAPFHAVRVVPGSFGSFAGLGTDGAARVLDGQGEPVPGLYAVGGDTASVMGGFYPAGGINLGPALTFGHIAALHAAGHLEDPLP